MKILSPPIKALSHFKNGTPRPLRFKLPDQEIKIEQVVSTTKKKLVGDRPLCFRCQCEIAVALKPFKNKFELGICK